MIKNEFYTLRNNIKIPKIGFGTWQIPNEFAYEATINAIKAGYRLIDTAYVYKNECSIGKAIKELNINREDLFITSKLPAQYKGYDLCIKYFNETLKNLDLDYLDLYLIHAPWPWDNVGMDCKNGNIESWRAMIDLYNMGKIKAIGVSNFQPEDIIPLVSETNFYPMVNQIRFFIGNTQERILDYCLKNNILVEAYSPLATGKLLNDPTIISISNKYNTTPAKLCIRYCIERNTLPIIKSTHYNRLIDNLDVDFKINDCDMSILNKIHNPELDRPLRS